MDQYRVLEFELARSEEDLRLVERVEVHAK